MRPGAFGQTQRSGDTESKALDSAVQNKTEGVFYPM